jgi:hypothetical protein
MKLLLFDHINLANCAKRRAEIALAEYSKPFAERQVRFNGEFKTASLWTSKTVRYY